MQVAIYTRCSTDETRQDIETQISECQRYCQAQGWTYKIFQEYETAYKDNNKRKIFEQLLDKLRMKEFNCLMVYMLDRFSRQTPTKVVSDLHKIVQAYGCRFISLKEGIDSNNEMWQILMMVFAWMSNNYSKMLSLRIREAIVSQKKKGEYTGGRPRKEIDINKVRDLYNQTKSLRKTAESYNQGRYKNNRISRYYVHQVIKSPVRKTILEIPALSPTQGINNL